MAPVSSDFRDPGQTAGLTEVPAKGCQVQAAIPAPAEKVVCQRSACLWVDSYSPGGETHFLSTESSEWPVPYVFY